MINIRKILYNIFGKLWLQLWAENWLTENIIKAFQHIFFPRLQVFQYNIHAQLASGCILHNTSIPYKLRTAKQVKHASIPVTDVVIGTTVIGTSDSTTWQLRVVSGYDAYQQLNTQAFDILPGYKKLDNWLLQSDTLYLKQDPARLNLKQQCMQQSDSLIPCYILWGQNPSYIDMQDKFTEIMDLPQQWLYKYPGIMQQAYYGQQFGCSLYSALNMLGVITGFPVASVGGTVDKVNQETNTVYISGIAHTGCAMAVIGVSLHQHVRKGDPLFKYNGTMLPSVLTYKDPDTAFTQVGISKLPVTTSVGVFDAYMSSQSTVLSSSDSDAVYVLPLKDNDSIPAKYKEACQTAADRPIQWPVSAGKINVLSQLIHNIWRKHFVIFRVPAVNTADVSIALQFIKRNTRADTVMYSYTDAGNIYYQQPLTITQSRIQYYNNSINNTYQLMVNCYDL